MGSKALFPRLGISKLPIEIRGIETRTGNRYKNKENEEKIAGAQIADLCVNTYAFGMNVGLT